MIDSTDKITIIVSEESQWVEVVDDGEVVLIDPVVVAIIN